MKIGYARVSRQDQNLERQIFALQQEGCEEIYQEKISGGKDNRPELDKMLDRLHSGDIVVIVKLDRLARNTRHLLNLVDSFEKKKVEFKSLGDNFDTSTATGRAFFQIMGVIAELEKSMLSERTKDALANAKRNGKLLGPPRKNYEKDVARMKECSGSVKEVMSSMQISRSKYFRLKKIANKIAS